MLGPEAHVWGTVMPMFSYMLGNHSILLWAHLIMVLHMRQGHSNPEIAVQLDKLN